MSKVAITRRIDPAAEARLKPHAEVIVWPSATPPTAAELRTFAHGCDGLLTMLTDAITDEFLTACPTVKVVANYAVGINNFDLTAAQKHGVKLGNTPGVLTEATADIAVSLMLSCARRLPDSSADARAGNWHTWEPLGWMGVDLAGQTVGIVGMGRIGLAAAKKLHHGWGMRVLYTARNPKPNAEAEVHAKRVDFEQLIAESDFISVHTDLNASTRGLFGSTQFEKMKPTCVFINTSRGPVVDQTALVHALKSGQIFAAGLDVTDPEPLPPSHELFTLKNCLITPHIASATPSTRKTMAEMAADNLLAGLSGATLPYPVG